MDQRFLFITGMPRAGTTLLTFLMNYFENTYVYSDTEYHPMSFASMVRHPGLFVLKQPYGYFEEFKPEYTYADILKRPNWKIISLIRDPRDVLVSRHASDKSRYWVPFKVIPRVTREHLKHYDDPRVFRFKYEELVTGTQEVLDSIAYFIQRSYHPDWADFHKHWKVSNSRMSMALNGPRPIDPSNIGNWKKEEHSERLAEIMADDEIRQCIVNLGYKSNGE